MLSKLGIIIFLLILLPTNIDNARILLVGLQMPSHILELTYTGIELTKRGHSVYRLIASAFDNKERVNHDEIINVVYQSKERSTAHWTDPRNEQFFFEFMMKHGVTTEFQKGAAQQFADDCADILNDQETMNKLRSLELDLAIVDRFQMSYCNYLIPYVLGIPFVSQASHQIFYLGGTPTLASFTSPGDSLFPPNYSDQKTFFQRLYSFLLQVYTVNNEKHNYKGVFSKALLHQYAPEISYWQELVDKSLLHFIIQDNALSWPQPSISSVLITSASRKGTKRKQLPIKLANVIANQHSKGVIVVSFGSLGSAPPNFFVEKLLNAFIQFNYTFFWRLNVERIKVSLNELPSNIHILPWLPQDELLAHPQTRLFIGHGGANGVYETVSHGVPMIVIPTMADQYFNAFRLVQRGCALTLDLQNFQPSDLVNAMNAILKNESFYINTRLRSDMMHDGPMKSRELIAYWIDHILKFRHEHLRSGALELIWYEYFMVDVMLFIVAAVGIAFIVLKVLHKLFCKK